MSSRSRRVVVTGIGAVNPLGLNAADFWEGLRAGKNGIRAIRSFDASSLPSRIGGEIVGFDAKKYIDKKDRKSLRVMARGIQLAVAAAQLALDDSKIDKEKLDATRFGVEFGAGLLPTELQEIGPASQLSSNCQPGVVDLQAWGEQGLPAIPPLWMLKYLPNMLGCHVSILHNAQGPSNSITEGDVSALLAVGEAYRIIGRGHGDYFLAGGADSKLNALSMVRQALFGRLSERNDPERACRPFDRGHDGVVLGEGGAVLALEDLEHAQKRGARIYAEIVGFGAAFDAQRTGKGIARAIRAALGEAKITPDDIDHVNAHGLSVPEIDRWEARGIREAFGACKRTVPVFAPSSYFGNTGAGSGTTELAASLLALHHGQVPKTLNFETPDPESPIPVSTTAAPVSKSFIVKIGFTELGQCAAVVCRKWD